MPLNTVMKIGRDDHYIVTDVPSAKMIEFRLETTAATGDNRGIYQRYLLGSTGGGESLRSVTEVHNTVVGTAHGAHLSLEFDATGHLTGLGAGVRATLMIPDSATFGGTVCALMAEIYHNGTASTLAGCAHSNIRLVNDGSSQGKATHKYWFAFDGGSAISVHTGTASGTAKLLGITIDGAEYWIQAYPSHT
jgi:hypothetical protein